MSLKRSRFLLAVFFILFLALIARVCYIQLYDGQKLARAASAQRIANSQIEKPRGNILDRNGIPFTNRDTKVSIALKPLSIRGKEDEINSISQVLDIDTVKLKEEIEIKREPIILEVDRKKLDFIKSLNIQEISTINTLKRYDDNSIARHVLGYISGLDLVGEAGIEKSYEKELKFDSRNVIGVITDARNNLLQGLGYRMVIAQDRDRKHNVKLTLDYHIQGIVEWVMDRENITGAVVVEDVCTGDIVAMASKPDYNQNMVEDYLNSRKRELFNRAVGSYDVGSTFKIIVAAAAMESGQQTAGNYFCSGSEKIGDTVFKCLSYDKGGHGSIDFEEAFAVSCNSYFIDLGMKLGREKILDMARNFGFGSVTGIKSQGIDESAGNLPSRSFYTDGEIGNISIGQGDVMATPLQVADMVATVANGGIKNDVNIVDCIVDDNESMVKSVSSRSGKRVISKETADRIKKMMEKVVETGTASKAAYLEEFGGAAGKTGSAETGQYINGVKVVQAWFGGYFPKGNPRYSVAVFVEDGKAGGLAAVPVFAGIAEEIMKKGY